MVVLWVVPHDTPAALSVFQLLSVIDGNMKSALVARLMNRYHAIVVGKQVGWVSGKYSKVV